MTRGRSAIDADGRAEQRWNWHGSRTAGGGVTVELLQRQLKHVPMSRGPRDAVEHGIGIRGVLNRVA